MTASATPLNIYQLRIALRGISPLIWRRVLVCSDTTLAHLHAIRQILFAWSDEPLPCVHIHGQAYGSSSVQTRRVLLSDLHLHRGERFQYVYDFIGFCQLSHPKGQRR
jgi:Plasmid pRiA4b ORF-3-like protein